MRERIELSHRGFADPRVTTSPPHQELFFERNKLALIQKKQTSFIILSYFSKILSWMKFKNVFYGCVFFVFVGGALVALLKIGPKLLPDLGRVVEKGGYTCVEFKDQRKNYVWGEIKVVFDPSLTGIEAHRLLKTEDLALKDDDILNYSTGSSYIVNVPRGDEDLDVSKLKSKEGIKDAGLVNCN